MKKLVSLVLVAALTMGVLSGCSTAGESSGAAGENPTEQEVTVAITSTIDKLDPLFMSTTQMGVVFSNMGATFYGTDAYGKLVPDLGESVEKSEDGLTYTFKIKDGLVWSDGVPLTAEHFVYGIKRAIGYGPDNAYSKRNLTNFIKGAQEAANAQLDAADMDNFGVVALDDTTFQITLASPCPFFERVLTEKTTAPVRPDFAPEHESTWSVNSGYPSCGPMILESVVPEAEAVLVKNEKYWNAEAVTLDKATFVVMPDSNAQLNAFRTGDIDIALNVPTEAAGNAEFTDCLAKPLKYVSSYFLLVNSGPKNTVPALKDANVRKALAMSIDKETMLRILGANGYNIQLDGFIPYGFEDADGSDFRDAVSYYQYDLEGAKKLMEAAGFNENNRLSFEYFYSEGGSHEDIAVLLKEMWSQIYVDLELTSVEQGVYYDYVDNGEFTVCRYSNNDSTDPLNYFSIFTSTSQIEGCQSVNDPVYDQMVAEAYTITDTAEYMAKLHEIEDYFVGEKQYVIPLMTQTPVILAKENLDGLWFTVIGTAIVTGVTVS